MVEVVVLESEWFSSVVGGVGGMMVVTSMEGAVVPLGKLTGGTILFDAGSVFSGGLMGSVVAVTGSTSMACSSALNLLVPFALLL